MPGGSLSKTGKRPISSNANNLIPHESVGVTGYGAPYKNGICSITRVDSMKD